MAERTTHEEFTKRLLGALNKCNINYLVIGGIAAIYYGRPRSTQDCDVIISLEESQIKNFCSCLAKQGFDIRESDVLMAFREKSHFNAYLHDFLLFRADFSWKSASPLNTRSFERSKEEVIFGVHTRIESPENLVVAKLVYGSQQDLDDAEAILRMQKNIDMAYMKKRAAEEGVGKALATLLKRIEG